jgi:hypothetical protein
MLQGNLSLENLYSCKEEGFNFTPHTMNSEMLLSNTINNKSYFDAEKNTLNLGKINGFFCSVHLHMSNK